MKAANYRITLFVQCLVDVFFPGVADAVVAVLEHLGMEVDCPVDQTCCGQPAFNAGYDQLARKSAMRFIRLFEHGDYIVGPSGSCVHMIRHHYPRLFSKQDPWRQRAESVSQRTFEFSEFLVKVLGITDLGAKGNGIVTFHDSCHGMRGLGIWDYPRQLIRNIRGMEFVEMPNADRCCGFGGAFSVKYPEISTAMAWDKAQWAVASGADTVVGLDVGCLMNIRGALSRMGSPIQVRHLAQLLAGGIPS